MGKLPPDSSTDVFRCSDLLCYPFRCTSYCQAGSEGSGEILKSNWM